MSQPPSLQTLLHYSHYAQPTKQYLNGELSYLLTLYPSLYPTSSKTRTRDTVESGVVRNCVSLEGTIRVPYKGSSFNIPIKITYFEGYPSSRPSVELQPTPDMVVRPNEYVDGKGTVVSEFMKKWSLNCNSTELIKDLIAMFAYKMPIFARDSHSRDCIQRGERIESTGIDPKQVATPLANVYHRKAEELILEIDGLRVDRRSLRASQETTEIARNSYIADTDEFVEWVRSQSAGRASVRDLDALLPEDDSASQVMLESLSRLSALEDTANALTDLHAMRKIPIEALVRTLKSVYRSQFVEVLKRDKAAQRLRRSR